MSVSIDVDVEDIIWGMSKWEKQEMVDSLYDDGFIAKQLGVHPDDKVTSDFDIEISKLLGNDWRLSTEDVEIIMNICKKII